MKWSMRMAQAIDADRLEYLERVAYSPPDYPPRSDCAASLDTIKYRINGAQDFFLVLEDTEGESLEGLIMGSLSESVDVVQQMMSHAHQFEGKFLLLHSVVVSRDYRRKGLASAMLQAYILHAWGSGVRSILLKTPTSMLSLFLKAGFSSMGTSGCTQGGLKWVDCLKQNPRKNRSSFILKTSTGLRVRATDLNFSEVLNLVSRKPEQLYPLPLGQTRLNRKQTNEAKKRILTEFSKGKSR